MYDLHPSIQGDIKQRCSKAFSRQDMHEIPHLEGDQEAS